MNRNSETEYEKLIKTYMSKIKEVEICKRTGLKISYISKIKNGKRVPKEYDTLERIMNAINLTGQKRMELTMAYQLERDRSLGMFYKAFTKLHTLQYPHPPKAYRTVQQSRIKNLRKNTVCLSGDDLIAAIKQLVESADNEVLIFFTPLSDYSSDKMCAALYDIPDNITLHWLMPFDDRSKGYEKLNIVVNCFKILSLKSFGITKFTCDLNELLEIHPFPFFIMNEREIIQFSNDMSFGERLTDPVLRDLYFQKYKNSRRLAKSSFIRSFDLLDNTREALAVVGNDIAAILGRGCEYYVLGPTPCIIFGTQESRTLLSIMAKGIDRLQIPNHYTKLLKMILENSEKIIHFFSYDCFQHYLDDENFYEISPYLSQNIPKEMRFKRTVDFLSNSGLLGENRSNKRVGLYGMNIPEFSLSNPFTGMNMVNNTKSKDMGMSVFFYDFNEKTMLIAINDKSITENFIYLMEILNKPGLIDTTEQTMLRLEKELEVRGVLLND